MKQFVIIIALLLGIFFSSLFNTNYCYAQETTVGATIISREGKSQDVIDVQFMFIKNGWVNVHPQRVRSFNIGIRYADSGTFKLSEILLFSFREIKEIDWKEKFATGVIIRKRDGSYIDIDRSRKTDSALFIETINFYSQNGELIKSKKINYCRFMPDEKSHPDWVIHSLTGQAIGNDGGKTRFEICVPHDIRKIVFHANKM